VIYTTNVIESLHMQLRKIIKTRGHFPSDEAATKLLWLALRNILAGKVKLTREWESGHESACRDVRRSIHEHQCVKPASHTEFMTGPQRSRQSVVDKREYHAAVVLNRPSLQGRSECTSGRHKV